MFGVDRISVFSIFICDLKQLFGVNFAARAREDMEKLDTRARKKMMRLHQIAMVSCRLLFCLG